MIHGEGSGMKMVAAAIGGGALVAMGVFTAVLGDPPTSTGPTSVAGSMSTGVTITEATPAATLATSVAVPPVKATAYK